MALEIKIKNLKLATILYLLIPVLLFFYHWLRIEYAILLSFCLIYPFRDWFKKNSKNTASFKINYWLIFLILGLGWVAISGSGAFGLQSHDHLKPNAIYKDLIEGSTPLKYLFNNETYFLSSYLAYYIPIPLLFGFLGWQATMILVYIFTAFGVLLRLLWFSVLSKTFSPIAVVVFIFIAGLDIIGYLSNNGPLSVLINDFLSVQPFWSNSPSNSDGMLLLYQSNTHTLFWGPQHALAGWLCSGMFFYELLEEEDNVFSTLYLSILPFWSPFILLGLAPFYVYAVFKQGFSTYLTKNNFVLIPVLTILYLFVNSIPMGSVDKGFIFDSGENRIGYSDQILHYFKFLFSEVYIWAIPVCLILYKNISKKEYYFLIFTITILTLLPLYKLGIYNDWAQRCSIPALFILWVYALKAFVVSKKYVSKIILFLLFLLGAWDSSYFIDLSLNATQGKIKQLLPKYENVKSYLEVSNEQGWPLYHSFANKDSFFYKHFAKDSPKPLIIKDTENLAK